MRTLPSIIAICASVLLPSLSPAQPICLAMSDADSGLLLKQEGACERRMTPASTFKIALSLMGYDAGFLIDERRPALPFKSGYPDWIGSWRQTTTPSMWMENSVLWYSQQLTQALGAERFARYVTLFNYGNSDVSGNPGQNDGLTRAWLTSSLRISPLEQLDFLRGIVQRRFPLQARAYERTAQLTSRGAIDDGWQVHGKTGTGYAFDDKGGVDRSHQVGWFVGWASKNHRTITFAYCIERPNEPSIRAGLEAREILMKQLPRTLASL